MTRGDTWHVDDTWWHRESWNAEIAAGQSMMHAIEFPSATQPTRFVSITSLITVISMRSLHRTAVKLLLSSPKKYILEFVLTLLTEFIWRAKKAYSNELMFFSSLTPHPLLGISSGKDDWWTFGTRLFYLLSADISESHWARVLHWKAMDAASPATPGQSRARARAAYLQSCPSHRQARLLPVQRCEFTHYGYFCMKILCGNWR